MSPGTQGLEPSLLPLRACVSNKLESGAAVGFKHRHSDMDLNHYAKHLAPALPCRELTGHFFSRWNLWPVVPKNHNVFISSQACKILSVDIGSFQALQSANELASGYFLSNSIPFSITHTWQGFLRGFFHYAHYLVTDVDLVQCLY